MPPRVRWTLERANMFRVWTRQLVTLAFQYVKAAAWSRRAAFLLNFISIFSSVFTIPGYGCGLVTGEVCAALQWLGIIIGVLAGVGNGIGFAYDPATRAMTYDNVAKALLKLSREISLELGKRPADRSDSDTFASAVVARYDSLIDNVRLPFYIRGEQQLANLSLLQAYTLHAHSSAGSESPASSSSSSSSLDTSREDSDSRRATEDGDDDAGEGEYAAAGGLATDIHVPLNDQDRAVMQRIESEFNRLAQHESAALRALGSVAHEKNSRVPDM